MFIKIQIVKPFVWSYSLSVFERHKIKYIIFNIANCIGICVIWELYFILSLTDFEFFVHILVTDL